MYLKKMKKLLPVIAIFFSTFSTTACSENLTAQMNKKDVYQAMKHVSDWQWQQFNAETNLFEGYDKLDYMSPTAWDTHPQGWVYASFHVGMAKWAQLADANGDESYFQKLKAVAARNNYLVAPRIYNADDYAIGQLYLDVYEKYKQPEALVPLKTVFDIILNAPSTASLDYKHIQIDANAKADYTAEAIEGYGGREIGITPCKNRWCWADALFMGPPVWMHLAKVTGNQAYFDFANKEFWQTAELLWDKEDHLFYRDSRYFDLREENGQKIIWARGVGWVVAGLARMLEHIPNEHPQRGKYEDIFKKVMKRLASAQQDDGFWRPSVLAPERAPFKESSGTGLIAYAYAYGINQGLLDKQEYLPVVKKAWTALVGVVQPSGKFGWVQQINAGPAPVLASDTQVYGVAAFLLTGTEVYKMLDK
ncbi:glycoside hydrolase family 88/105 protein [Colwellia psychrerythraea]|uniref:Glycosyl hydrolase family 88 n=1 Tax=Colwellia psychrerythraea TaxID=28229 RepID=A0A099KD29_COLPS|nr:glycoside hydrolase family 88 protein [Colwellia psychrerythraea]KGJ88281.1 glycosyl hydrolase family 88 [Colwellia psychrerythraea]